MAKTVLPEKGWEIEPPQKAYYLRKDRAGNVTKIPGFLLREYESGYFMFQFRNEKTNTFVRRMLRDVSLEMAG